MHRLQLFDPALHRLRKLVIGEVHVDVLRVAAASRQRHRIKDRRLRRRRVVRVVAVERLAGDQPPGAEKFLVRHIIHLRETRDMVVLLVVRLQFAPDLHRADEIGRLVFLVAHDQHMVLRKGAVQRRAGLGIDRLRQVEAADLGAGIVRGQRRDRVRHVGASMERGADFMAIAPQRQTALGRKSRHCSRLEQKTTGRGSTGLPRIASGSDQTPQVVEKQRGKAGSRPWPLPREVAPHL